MNLPNKLTIIRILLVPVMVLIPFLGIEGEILSTPSHSNDSISLILDNGTCFVGNLEPIDYLDAYEENINLKNDWELVMNHKPKIIFYAHANEKVMA